MYRLLAFLLVAPLRKLVKPCASVVNARPGIVSANSRKLRVNCGHCSIWRREPVLPTSEVRTSSAAGLTPATAGEVRIGGHLYRDIPNPGRHVGVLLDASAQHVGRTGREVLVLSAKLMGSVDITFKSDYFKLDNFASMYADIRNQAPAGAAPAAGAPLPGGVPPVALPPPAPR